MKTQMNIRIEKDLKDWVEEKAKSQSRSVNNFVVLVLEDMRKKEKWQEEVARNVKLAFRGEEKEK